VPRGACLHATRKIVCKFETVYPVTLAPPRRIDSVHW
jgi:hypothetical protein